MELVVVIVVMGILAATALPRFFGTSTFHEMGYSDSLAGAARYARRLAINSGCDTRIAVNSNGFALWQRASGCDSGALSRPVQRPGASNWAVEAPDGVALGSLDIYFDAQGRPHHSVDDSLMETPQDLSVGSRSLRFEPFTGLVHRP